MNKRGAADAQGRAGGASGRAMPTPSVHKLSKGRVWRVQSIDGCHIVPWHCFR
jgi:hypothetical protein